MNLLKWLLRVWRGRCLGSELCDFGSVTAWDMRTSVGRQSGCATTTTTTTTTHVLTLCILKMKVNGVCALGCRAERRQKPHHHKFSCWLGQCGDSGSRYVVLVCKCTTRNIVLCTQTLLIFLKSHLLLVWSADFFDLKKKKSQSFTFRLKCSNNKKEKKKKWKKKQVIISWGFVVCI